MAGEDASSRYDKAVGHAIPVLGEDAFRDLLAEGLGSAHVRRAAPATLKIPARFSLHAGGFSAYARKARRSCRVDGQLATTHSNM